MNISQAILGTLVSLILFFSLFWVYPVYKVWQKDKAGEAQLMEAKQNRQIQIEEAQANLEAERLNAESEIVRAKGMATAMEIENGQLSSTYNQYLFIRSLEKLAKHGDLPQIIYLPSEGMLPVMDLNKHSNTQNE